MLQWMGGSRKSIKQARNSLKNRQSHFFQQQRVHNKKLSTLQIDEKSQNNLSSSSPVDHCSLDLLCLNHFIPQQESKQNKNNANDKTSVDQNLDLENENVVNTSKVGKEEPTIDSSIQHKTSLQRSLSSEPFKTDNTFYDGNGGEDENDYNSISFLPPFFSTHENIVSNQLRSPEMKQKKVNKKRNSMNKPRFLTKQSSKPEMTKQNLDFGMLTFDEDDEENEKELGPFTEEVHASFTMDGAGEVCTFTPKSDKIHFSSNQFGFDYQDQVRENQINFDSKAFDFEKSSEIFSQIPCSSISNLDLQNFLPNSKKREENILYSETNFDNVNPSSSSSSTFLYSNDYNIFSSHSKNDKTPSFDSEDNRYPLLEPEDDKNPLLESKYIKGEFVSELNDDTYPLLSPEVKINPLFETVNGKPLLFPKLNDEKYSLLQNDNYSDDDDDDDDDDDKNIFSNSNHMHEQASWMMFEDERNKRKSSSEKSIDTMFESYTLLDHDHLNESNSRKGKTSFTSNTSTKVCNAFFNKRMDQNILRHTSAFDSHQSNQIKHDQFDFINTDSNLDQFLKSKTVNFDDGNCDDDGDEVEEAYASSPLFSNFVNNDPFVKNLKHAKHGMYEMDHSCMQLNNNLNINVNRISPVLSDDSSSPSSHTNIDKYDDFISLQDTNNRFHSTTAPFTPEEPKFDNRTPDFGRSDSLESGFCLSGKIKTMHCKSEVKNIINTLSPPSPSPSLPPPSPSMSSSILKNNNEKLEYSGTGNWIKMKQGSIPSDKFTSPMKKKSLYEATMATASFFLHNEEDAMELDGDKMEKKTKNSFLIEEEKEKEEEEESMVKNLISTDTETKIKKEKEAKARIDDVNDGNVDDVSDDDDLKNENQSYERVHALFPKEEEVNNEEFIIKRDNTVEDSNKQANDPNNDNDHNNRNHNNMHTIQRNIDFAVMLPESEEDDMHDGMNDDMYGVDGKRKESFCLNDVFSMFSPQMTKVMPYRNANESHVFLSQDLEEAEGESEGDSERGKGEKKIEIDEKEEEKKEESKEEEKEPKSDLDDTKREIRIRENKIAGDGNEGDDNNDNDNNDSNHKNDNNDNNNDNNNNDIILGVGEKQPKTKSMDLKNYLKSSQNQDENQNQNQKHNQDPNQNPTQNENENENQNPCNFPIFQNKTNLRNGKEEEEEALDLHRFINVFVWNVEEMHGEFILKSKESMDIETLHAFEKGWNNERMKRRIEEDVSFVAMDFSLLSRLKVMESKLMEADGDGADITAADNINNKNNNYNNYNYNDNNNDGDDCIDESIRSESRCRKETMANKDDDNDNGYTPNGLKRKRDMDDLKFNHLHEKESIIPYNKEDYESHPPPPHSYDHSNCKEYNSVSIACIVHANKKKKNRLENSVPIPSNRTQSGGFRMLHEPNMPNRISKNEAIPILVRGDPSSFNEKQAVSWNNEGKEDRMGQKKESRKGMNEELKLELNNLKSYCCMLENYVIQLEFMLKALTKEE